MNRPPDTEAAPVEVDNGVAAVGELRLCYQTRGSRSDPALLLEMGFGMQLDAWDESFCDAFVRRGFFLIRYDHRDVGLSSKLDGIEPDLRACGRGDFTTVPYTLYDLADDAVGLLDALGIEAAHVVGASMGGMVAQAIAIRHPARVRSLCSIMSTTGDPTLPGPTAEASAASLSAMRADSRDEAIEATVAGGRVFAGGGFPYDEDAARRRATAALDRSDYPQGKRRLAAAIMATGDRTRALADVHVPTLVIHGANDSLVPADGGRATAAAVPGAALMIIDGMGHEFPIGVRDRIVTAVAEHALR